MTLLTGLKSTGEGLPHLGNILGAIAPSITLSQQAKQSFFFIADLHALTGSHLPASFEEQVMNMAAAWLACGLDPARVCFYRQSQRPEVTELAWYLSCTTPFPMLANAHAFKDKQAKGEEAMVNGGLVTYPVLQAADIALYNATHVPVGKDQAQHLEITRDILQRFNHRFGKVFTIPQAIFPSQAARLPGSDGRKMSKSYGNMITPFVDQKTLRKSVMRIVTDSTPAEAPKDPATCTIMALYRHIAPQAQVDTLEKRYREGSCGYGEAKKMLYEAICLRFAQERQAFERYRAHPAELRALLQAGEQKAQRVAAQTLMRVRKALGIPPQSLGTR